MTSERYRYTVAPMVEFEEIEASLVLALLAVESLHGESQTRLDAAHATDATNRVLVIDASTTVGQDLNRLFVGFLKREFGPDAFRVEHLRGSERRQPEEVAA